MWIINIFICAALYLTILYTWSRRRFDKCMSWILLGYFCCPVFKCGSLEVSGSYFITLMLIIFCAEYLQSGKARLNKDGYPLFQIVSIALMLMAGVINGVFGTEIIVPLIGLLNLAVGTFGCMLFFRRTNNPLLVLRKAVVRANVCHILLGVLQLTNTSAGYKITRQLYVTADRSIPLDGMMEMEGAFGRVFGATFNPTILGGYVLLAFSFVFAVILMEKRMGKNNLILLASTVLLGFTAFSKTAIIGIPLIGFVFLMRSLICDGMQYRRLFFQFATILLIGFGVILLLANHYGLMGRVRYYFGLFTNPLQIFQNRYGSSINMGDPNATSGMAGMLAMFMKHPIIGVGMVAVLDEFAGDSQYLSLLHDGGIVLFVITLSFYISVFMRQRKAKGLSQMMILFALLFVALATNVFTVSNYIPFIAFGVGVRGMIKSKEIKNIDNRLKSY